MMQLADVLREERVHMKLSEAKYQLEEKNAAVDKLRNQLEAFIGPKRAKEKGRAAYHVNEEIAAYLNKARSLSHQNEVNEDDGGEVEDGVECEDDSADSDLHSIELNMDNNNKSYKWTYPSGTPCDLRKAAIDEEEIKGRKSTSSKAPRRSTSLQRSVSDGVEWSTQNERLSITGDGMDWGGLSELERHLQGKSYADELADEMHGYQTVKGVRDYLLSSSRIDSARSYGSPTRQVGQRPLRDPNNAAQERPPTAPGNASKSRLGEGINGRKSKW
ncbi:hypothetical protein GH714_030795 [Hevea brasiliensis]|nr:hypothetical protein GH714_030795 [Hevea brasiliensis]